MHTSRLGVRGFERNNITKLEGKCYVVFIIDQSNQPPAVTLSVSALVVMVA